MSEEAKVLRLFVAVELPPAVKDALAQIQARLKTGELARLRWVRPESMHITLKFLGATPAVRRAEIESALGKAVEGASPFAVRLGKLGKFGGRQNPRVLWVDAGGDTDALGALQKRVEEELAPLGFPPQDRPFSVHLTLARIPQDLGRAAAQPVADAIASTEVPALPVPVRAVALMLSELRRDGAVYTRLAAFPLS